MRHTLTILILVVAVLNTAKTQANSFKQAYEKQSPTFFWSSVASSALFLLPRADKDSNLGWMDNSFDRYFSRFEGEKQVGDFGTWYSQASLPLTLSPFVASFYLTNDRVQAYSDMLLYLQMLGLHSGVKGVTRQFLKRERPDGSDTKSFPSGHTAHMFMAAHFLSKKYSNSIVTSASLYLVASAFSFTRIVDRKHHATDVLAGAVFGLLVTESVLRFYNSRNKLVVIPVMNEDSYGVALKYKF